MTNLNRVITVVFAIFCITATAQDDLMALLESKQENTPNYVTATFKGTRLVSGHSVETVGKGDLNFMINHRFGRLNSGWRNLFGIDNSTVRLGFTYGISDDLSIGIGRSSFGKLFDGTVKWRFLRQQIDGTPVTLTAVSAIYASSAEWENPQRENLFSSRISYHNALLIARKINKNLSLQLMPTIVHRNVVKKANDNNTIYAIGAGSSLKITPSTRLNVEYYYLPENQLESTIGGESVKSSLSVGFDIETGGHVFQLHVTNSHGMTEKYLVGETTGDLFNGDIHFGFNVSRVFTVKKEKKPQQL